MRYRRYRHSAVTTKKVPSWVGIVIGVPIILGLFAIIIWQFVPLQHGVDPQVFTSEFEKNGWNVSNQTDSYTDEKSFSQILQYYVADFGPAEFDSSSIDKVQIPKQAYVQYVRAKDSQTAKELFKLNKYTPPKDEIVSTTEISNGTNYSSSYGFTSGAYWYYGKWIEDTFVLVKAPFEYYDMIQDLLRKVGV